MKKQEIIEVVRRYEFAGEGNTCVACGRTREEGHEDGCKIHEAATS